MSGKPDAKVLRIGIIQGGKIVEERLLRKRAKVTIGLGQRNTFVLPISTIKSHTLFDLHGDHYELVLTSEMDGRVAVGGEALDVAALKQRGLAKARGAEHVLPLTEGSRGKVVLGDVTVLFQFVVPPPIPAAPKLPAIARGGWAKQIDWVYTATVLTVGVLEYGMIGYMKTLDLKKEPPKLENLDARFAKILVPEMNKPPEPEKKAAVAEKGEGKKEDDKKKADDEAKKKVAKKTDDDDDAKKSKKGDDDKAKPEDKAVVTQRVAKVGILGALGPGSTTDKAVADVFNEGKVDSDIDSTFKKADAVAVANQGDGRARASKGGTDEGVGSAETVGDDKLTGGGTGRKLKKVAVTAEPKRDAPPPTGLVKGGAVDVSEGEIEDPNAIAAVIRRRIGAVKGCYDLALKRNPDIKGKVVVKFTIGETGAVVDISIEDNTTGDNGVASCISGRVRNFRFPKPKSGKVTVAYPFILQAAKG